MSFSATLARIRDLDPANNTIYKKTDDQTFGRLFSDVFKDRICFNVTARSWYYYDGKIWKEDPESMNTEGLAKIFSRAMYVYAGSGNVGDDYRKAISSLGDRRNRVRMIQDSRDYCFMESSYLDQQKYLFNTRSGVFDLKEMKLIPHDPKLLLSKISNVVYDPDADSSDFETFMEQILSGDMDLVRYMQDVFGYALLGENSQEIFHLLYGSNARNGKGTLMSCMGYLFGSYAETIQPESLAVKKEKNSSGASEDLAKLYQIRFLNCSEPPKRMKMDIALVKNVTGRDEISARKLYQAFFRFRPCFHLFINSNFLPLLTDDSLFEADRIRVVPFRRHFTAEERDVHLKDRLMTEKSISGIFNWCLTGLRRYWENGETLNTPEAVLTATKEYQSGSDKIDLFMSDCLRPSDGVILSAGIVYVYYLNWCKKNGYFVESKGSFFSDLRARSLLEKTGTVDGKTVKNVIKDFALDDSASAYAY